MELVFALMLYTTESKAFALAPIIDEESERGGVDPYLVIAIIQKESTFRKRACFRGAHGLMQIQTRSRSCSKRAREKAWRLYRPRINIRKGIALMKWAESLCRRKRHKRHHWLLHYNQGEIVTTKGKAGRYAKGVLRIYEGLAEEAL